MKENKRLLTVVAFDGTNFCIFESTEPDKELEKMTKYNIHLDILSDGYGVTRLELENLFISNIIRKTKKLTWFIMDSAVGQLLVDICADDLKITSVTLQDGEIILR